MIQGGHRTAAVVGMERSAHRFVSWLRDLRGSELSESEPLMKRLRGDWDAYLSAEKAAKESRPSGRRERGEPAVFFAISNALGQDTAAWNAKYRQWSEALVALSAWDDRAKEASVAEASGTADEAQTAATRGDHVVGQAVAAMNEIDAASRQIADIIAIIDGIAFQTNILALNAAVETARAGEQGRSFAVEAVEVRSLAQRSATAAREIKSLIEATLEKVASGSEHVKRAGGATHEIMTSVQRVSATIASITGETAQQRQGIGQANASVSELDQGAQQNAALAEQSAAAAMSLQAQAQRLKALVERFKLEGSPV